MRDHSIGLLNLQELSSYRVDVLAPWEHDQRPVRVNVVVSKRRQVDQVNAMVLRRNNALQFRNPSSHEHDIVLFVARLPTALPPIKSNQSDGSPGLSPTEAHCTHPPPARDLVLLGCARWAGDLRRRARFAAERRALVPAGKLLGAAQIAEGAIARGACHRATMCLDALGILGLP